MTSKISGSGKSVDHVRRGNRWSVFIFLVIAGALVFVSQLPTLKDTGVSPEEQRAQVTKTQFKSFEIALKEFYRLCGIFPTTAQGLGALVHKPDGMNCSRYEIQIPVHLSPGAQLDDAWHVPYKYQSDGNHYKIEASHGLAIEGP